jgi:hypothetical protein
MTSALITIDVAAPTRNSDAPKPAIPELVWIQIAKRPETRVRRIRESIELLSAGKKLGLK